MPVTLTVASLTSVILPSGLMVTRGSRLASIRLRAYCAACLLRRHVACRREDAKDVACRVAVDEAL